MMTLTPLQLSWLYASYPKDEVVLASTLPYDTAFKLYSDALSYGPNFQEVLSVAENMKALRHPQSGDQQDSEDAYLGLRKLLPANHSEILTIQGTTNAPEVISFELSTAVQSIHMLAEEVQASLNCFQMPDFWELAVILHAVAGQGLYDWNPYSSPTLWEGFDWAGSHYMPKMFTNTAKALATFNMEQFMFYKKMFVEA